MTGGLPPGSAGFTYSVYKGYYRSSGQGFRAGFERGLWCVMCQGCPAQCAAVAWQDSGVVDAGGKGSYRVGGVIFERRSPSCRRWHTAFLFEFFRRRSRGFVAAGVALGRSGVAHPAGPRLRGRCSSVSTPSRRAIRYFNASLGNVTSSTSPYDLKGQRLALGWTRYSSRSAMPQSSWPAPIR